MNEKDAIKSLNIEEKIIQILNANKIKTIKQLCAKKKSDLKNMGLINTEINKIEIELQLLGLSLKNSL